MIRSISRKPSAGVTTFPGDMPLVDTGEKRDITANDSGRGSNASEAPLVRNTSAV